jgi:exopolysaccharide biosynthesis polyprenyl glycosylphosphotransferase
MSILGKELRSVDATTSEAAELSPNMDVSARLPEAGFSPDLVRDLQQHPITDRELSLVQVCTDFLCACVAVPLALVLLALISPVHINSFSRLGDNTITDSLLPVGVIVALAVGGTYRATSRRLQPSAFLEMRDLSFGVGSGCVLVLAVAALLHSSLGTASAETDQLVLAAIVAIVVISIGRMLLRFFLHAMTTTRVLVVGSGKLADRTMMSVRQDPGMTLVGRAVDDDAVDPGAIGRVLDLPTLCEQFDVHRVLVVAPDRMSRESLNVYRRLQESVHVAMVPQYFELVSWRSRLTDLSGMPFLELARPHLSRWDQFMKRLFDLCISSFVLLVTSPLLVAVAIGVKLSSPGPVFFRQVRLGRNKVPFTITKFRTMTVGTEATSTDVLEAEAEDEERPLHEVRGKLSEKGRITHFGDFLRKTSIDEIPQFINVFRGDMSVVGPRPFIPSESRVEGWGTRRFDVRPGITGLWQVSGRNDLSRSDLVQLDYLYVASWSLWWDLKIMAETPKTMAWGVGAY